MQLQTATVAIIDDDFPVLESLEELFASGGYDVQLHASAEEFLGSPSIDNINCLISDIGLPGLNGIELLVLLRAQRRALPVILITACREEQILRRAIDSGARFVFVKPFDAEALLEAVAKVLGN
jgi:FixJ family two-component response regulator